MSKPIQLLDHRGNPIQRAMQPRDVRATYDYSKWTPEWGKQWSNVDALSARAANSREVRRRLYLRSRYVRANSGSFSRVVITLANDCVGTGPHLHMATDDDALNERIESEWQQWSEQIHLGTKLHTMRQSLCVDGEAFGLMNTNPAVEGPVQLDIKLIEADQIQTPWLNPIDPLAVDGIRYDVYFNPIEYSMLRYHPGDYFQIGYIADPIDARAMVHWFNRERPGQCRGVPEGTPVLGLFPLIDRYMLAAISAAEAAADFAVVLKSQLPPDADEDEGPVPFSFLDIARRTMMTLPAGCDIGQIDPKQPGQNFDILLIQMLKFAAGPWAMPLHKITGDASGYNYSSARLDTQEYNKCTKIDQTQLVHWVLEPIWKAWLVEMSLASDLLQNEGGTLRLTDLKHTWFFDGQGHVDPHKEASAQEIKLKNGTTTLAIECAREGKDWKAMRRQRARELAYDKELEAEFGIQMPQPHQGGAGFSRPPEMEAGWDDDGEEEVAMRPYRLPHQRRNS